MSLCLADVLMGLAGAGGIVATQFALLFGRINVFAFVKAHFLAQSFEDPEQAQVIKKHVHVSNLKHCFIGVRLETVLLYY